MEMNVSQNFLYMDTEMCTMSRMVHNHRWGAHAGRGRSIITEGLWRGASVYIADPDDTSVTYAGDQSFYSGPPLIFWNSAWK